MKKISLFICFFCFFLVFACTKDQTAEVPLPCDSTVSYNIDIKPIMETTCNLSTCHDGSGATDYRTFAQLQPFLDDGQFSNRVLTVKDMPKSNSQGPTSLTEDQLELIRTWVISGYPEETAEIQVTYEDGIKDILATNCGYDGCHNGTSTIGADGNYNNFEGIISDINDGSFLERVVTRRDNPNSGMPPNYAEDGPEDLSSEDFQMILCWIDRGYPEN